MHLTTLLVMPLITAEIAARLIIDSDAVTHDEQEEIKLSLRRLEGKLDRLEEEQPARAEAVLGQQPCRER